MLQRTHTIITSATPAANGLVTPAGLPNLAQSANPLVSVLVTVTGSGNLVLNLYAGQTDPNYALVGSMAPITAAGTYRAAFSPVLEPLLQLFASGVSGTINISSLQLLMTAPDS